MFVEREDPCLFGEKYMEKIEIIETVVLPYERLHTLITQLFGAWGFDAEDSTSLSTILLEADLRGIGTHGVQRLELYDRILREGYAVPGAQPQIVQQTPVSAVVDAQKAMGHLAGQFSMELALAKARETGIGIVSTRNSNHFGIAGYFAQLASAQGFIGICATNSYPIMAATFGDTPLIGSNPLAFAFPAEPYDFLYDASSTVVSIGRLELSAKLGQELPEPWGMDEQGLPTTDPLAILGVSPKTGRAIYGLGGAGELNGGHKGYGQGLIVEILTAILSSGRTAAGIAEHGNTGACHFFAALNPEIFGDVQAMQEQLAAYFEQLRHSNRHHPTQKIYLHGEKEAQQREANLKNGLTLAVPIVEELQSFLEQAGITF
jgi:LDH2 family malate/lactate/ureidoglycolate dehydrogenase